MKKYLAIIILIALLVIIGNYSPFILSLILMIMGAVFLVILAETIKIK